MNGSTTYCQCYSSFSGLNCEIVSEALQTARLISNISGFAAIGKVTDFFNVQLGFFSFDWVENGLVRLNDLDELERLNK